MSTDNTAKDHTGMGDLVPFPVPVPSGRPGTVSKPAVDVAGDTALEVEFDEAPAPAAVPVPVDEPADVLTGGAPVRQGERRPIVPVHLLPANLPVTARRVLGGWYYHGRFHAVRLPVYAVKVTGFAVRGLVRLAGRQIGWWWGADRAVLVAIATASGEIREAARLHREVRQSRTWRGMVLAGEVLAIGVGGPVAWEAAPGWVALASGAGVLALARYGRPMGRTIIGTAVVAPRYRKLNSDIVLRAYYAAGLGKHDKPDLEIRFGSPMARDARNTGSQVVVDLPYGKGWSDVLKAKEGIASGLDVHVNQVFLTPDRSSSRRHTLFVADRDPLAVAVGKTDMLDGKPRNIWTPARFGKDERDQLVTLSLMWISVLIGAQPRKGKTFAARQLALYAALDPYVKLIVVDGKNSPDWIKFPLVTHRAVFGTHPNPNDPDPLTHLMHALDEILEHIERVNQALAALPATVCPEGKLTEELARDPRYPDLRVLMLVMEEFQLYFETDDQNLNKEIAAKLSRIQAVGPSAGVIILSSSQKPSGVGAGDVGRLFNRYRDNHAARFALKCGNRLVSEAVLGGDAYAEGFDASSLPVGDDYRGVGYLYGLTDDTPTVRTFLADHTDAENILTAARTHRERLGLLTGAAAGQHTVRDTRDVLTDVRAVMDTQTGLHWPTVAARLAERIPQHYADITADAISAQCRALGVPSVDIKRDGQVLKGAKAAAIDQAIQRRNINGT